MTSLQMHVACIFMQLKGPLDRHTRSYTHTHRHLHTDTDYDRTYHSMAGTSALHPSANRSATCEGEGKPERVREWEWPMASEGEGGRQALHTLNSPQSRKQNRQKCWAHCLDDCAVLSYLSRSLSLSQWAPTLAVAIFNWACNWCEQ